MNMLYIVDKHTDLDTYSVFRTYGDLSFIHDFVLD